MSKVISLIKNLKNVTNICGIGKGKASSFKSQGKKLLDLKKKKKKKAFAKLYILVFKSFLCTVWRFFVGLWTATTKHYDWALLNNRDIRDKYVLELRNRFETLQEKTEKSTPNDEYENFVNAHLEAATKCIPTKLKTKYRVPWETLAVREKRALVKTASKNYRKNPTNTNALKLKTAQYQLAGIYIKEQTEYIQNQIDKTRDSVEDRQSRIAWQTKNEVSRRKNTAKAKLKAANQQERIKLWKQHFENLLGNPLKITHEPITRIISKQLDIKLELFTQKELDSVLRKIKNRKAAGLDEIPPEVWKTRQFDDILQRSIQSKSDR